MRASGGSRLEWGSIPATVRAQVDDLLGAAVTRATNEAGGFSPGLAARCELTDGRRVFLKAVSTDQNPMAPRVHRREVEVASILPPEVPAPRFLGSIDDGDWVVLAFDEVAGHQPREPWRWDELDLVVPAVIELSTQTFDGLAMLQTLAQRHGPVFGGWARLARGDGDATLLGGDAVRALDRLVDLETEWEDAGAGDRLLHADIRADNVLLTPDGGVVFVDWPWACRGSAVADLAMTLPSIGLGGGPGIDEVVARYDLARTFDLDALVTLVVAAAGFFARSSLDPAPPGLPRLRSFQRAQADVALAWLLETI